MDEYIKREDAINLLWLFADESCASVVSDFESIPAADVVEVRHGYWIDHHSGGSFCSACERWVPYSHHPKYCETCGARMDKEDEHDKHSSNPV